MCSPNRGWKGKGTSEGVTKHSHRFNQQSVSLFKCSRIRTTSGAQERHPTRSWADRNRYRKIRLYHCVGSTRARERESSFRLCYGPHFGDAIVFTWLEAGRLTAFPGGFVLSDTAEAESAKSVMAHLRECGLQHSIGRCRIAHLPHEVMTGIACGRVVLILRLSQHIHPHQLKSGFKQSLFSRRSLQQ